MMSGTRSIGCLLSIVIVPLIAGVSSAQVPTQRCIDCHSQMEVMLLPVVFEDGLTASAYINKDAFLQSAHGSLACTECHQEYHPEFNPDFDPSETPGVSDRKLPSRAEYTKAMNQRCAHCHEGGGEGDGHGKQISAVLHPAGKEKTPGCTDCHPPHKMGLTSQSAGISRYCIGCHEDVYQRFSTSVHGDAVGDTLNPDLPSCTHCHFGHVGGGKFPTARRARLGKPCMDCHGDAALMRKYDISSNVVTTYLQDFHGVSLHFYGGDLSEVKKFPLVCVDCHGYHDVKSLRDPAAVTELKTTMQQTCQKCHENATANFSEAWLAHREPSLSNNILVFLVKFSYTMLIPFVILGLMLHIGFDAIVLPWRKRRQTRRTGIATSTHDIELPPYVPKYFIRFSFIQRLEHLLVLATFVVLLITGLPQRYYDAGWAATVINAVGGIDFARQVHRVAGITLAVVAAFHFVRVGIGIMFRNWSFSMVPNRKDFEDAFGMLKYQLGLSDVRPKADRFDYGEKFEYWGMIFGTVVMVASGFVLIYPMVLAKYLPGQFISASRTAHSYEAMMALLTIIVWHMYGARFNPVIFTGRISSKFLAHHHPLEYERLVANLEQSETQVSDAPMRTPQPAVEPAGIGELARGNLAAGDAPRESCSTTRAV